MGKKIDAQSIDRAKLKSSTIICNLLIAALCIGAILVLAFADFWKINLTAVINEELLTMIEGQSQPQTATQTPDEAFTALKDAILSESDEDRTIRLGIQLNGATIIGCIAKQEEEIVTIISNDITESLIAQFSPIIKLAVKVTSKTAINTLVESAKAELIASGISETEIEAKLTELGIDPVKISTEVGSMIDELFSDAPNTEKVKNDILEIAEDISTKGNVSAEDFTAASEQFSEFYDQIITSSVNEQGKLDPSIMLQNIMNILNQTQPQVKMLATAAADNPATDQATTLDQAVQQFFLENQATISLVIKIMGGVVLLLMAAFTYTLFKIVIKTLFLKNKTVKIWLPLFLTDLIFIILVAIPNLALLLLPIIPGIPPELVSTLGSIKFAFLSSTIYAFAIGFAMFLIWAIAYRKLRKQSKAVVRFDKEMNTNNRRQQPPQQNYGIQ